MPLTQEIKPGVVLGDRFRVHRRLGSGGTATVFLAEDCVLGRDVAVKRLHAEGSTSDIQRFRREARLGASLVHPNLVTVFDTLAGSDGVLIVMEHVRGRPLSDLIGPDGMDPGRVVEILRPVASALDYAHEHGVVHRDVKPTNILIGEDGIVKLVDLGTATAGHMTQITTENEVLGTLAYIAPERLAGESAGEPAADVYALAVVAFEGLTGRTPQSAATPAELLPKLLREPPPDVAEIQPGLSPLLGSALKQGLDPDPDRRQHTASALIRDLEDALSGSAGERTQAVSMPTEPISPPTRDGRSFTPPPVSVRRRPGWLWPALACALALIAGAVWLGLSGGGGDGAGPADGGGQVAGNAGGSGAEGSNAGGSGGGDSGSASAPAAAGAASDVAASVPRSGSSPAAASSGTGAQLNDQGYSLIQEGRYSEAVPVLRRAVAAFPDGTTDITYAYALYNLGHALRMAGRPDEAIPILEQRLEIPDQTATVQKELAAARAAAAQ